MDTPAERDPMRSGAFLWLVTQIKPQLLALHIDLEVAVITLSLFHYDKSVQLECFLQVAVDNVIIFVQHISQKCSTVNIILLSE